ncbi:hypothetical protein D9757_013199 [Collybiopsis confluens]|uniref:Uncharacterized protein n=1 Tax=Collybiopsis confluens TaxID=2823264 RepID=A0A8H5LGW2_9AGAR|nr:hypothetical protein D9757_013199 [Collybiopsis confluens]
MGDVATALARLQNTIDDLKNNDIRGLRNDIRGIRDDVNTDLAAITTRLDGLEHSIVLGRAEAANDRRRLMNAREVVVSGQVSLKMQKIAPGSGYQLALPLRGAVNLPLDYLPGAIPAVGAELGYTPSNIDALQHLDILRAVIFYNEDFHILHTDDVGERRRKFRAWHTM